MTSVNETEGHKTPAAETLAAIADLENGGGERFSGETAELLRQLTEGEGND